MSTFHFPEGQPRMSMYSDLTFYYQQDGMSFLRRTPKIRRTPTHRDQSNNNKCTKGQGQGQMVSFAFLYEYQRLGLSPVTCNVPLVQYRLLGTDPE